MKNDYPTQQLNSNAASAQRQRLKRYLMTNGKITTFEAQIKLDIVCPAARIFELRHHQNLNIQTIRRKDHNSQGHAHHVAEYVLLPGNYNEIANDDRMDTADTTLNFKVME